MYAPERHQTILDAARYAGRVEVAALADLLDVTPETIRPPQGRRSTGTAGQRPLDDGDDG